MIGMTRYELACEHPEFLVFMEQFKIATNYILLSKVDRKATLMCIAIAWLDGREYGK